MSYLEYAYPKKEKLGNSTGYQSEKILSDPPDEIEIEIIVYLRRESGSTVTDKELSDFGHFVEDDIELIWGSQTYLNPENEVKKLKVNCNVVLLKDDAEIPELNKNKFYFEVGNLRTRSSTSRLGARRGYLFIPRVDNGLHTPAHEFGHMLGVEDRYHYYQNFTTDGLKVECLSHCSSHCDESCSCLFFSVPMLLPRSYDNEYQWDHNLYSSFILGTDKYDELVTNKQVGIFLTNYWFKTKFLGNPVESLPVYQYTFFYNRSNKTEPDWNNGPIGLIEGKNEDEFRIVQKGQTQEGKNILPGTLLNTSDKNGPYKKIVKFAAYYNPVLKKGNDLGEQLWNKEVPYNGVNRDYLNRSRMLKPYNDEC
jgi:hypothetical protein